MYLWIIHLVILFAIFVYLGVQSTFLIKAFCDRLEGFMFCSTVFVYNSKMTDFIHFYFVLLCSIRSLSSPNVVNPAVNADGHEHVEVDPQRKPVLGFLVAEPVHQSGFVDFGFEAVADIPWHWNHTSSTKVKRVERKNPVLNFAAFWQLWMSGQPVMHFNTPSIHATPLVFNITQREKVIDTLAEAIEYCTQ